MKILLIGSGGREHAIAWKLAQSKRVEKIYVFPGNGGTAMEEKTENLSLRGADTLTEAGQKLLLAFAKSEGIDLAVIGPEAPLEASIADRFRDGGLAVAGPGFRGAILETSKFLSKIFMEQHGIRTAKAERFCDLIGALDYAKRHFGKKGFRGEDAPPLVIKADGLAAGKGVVVAETWAEAESTLIDFMKNDLLGAAGRCVVLEQYLQGDEVSVLAAVCAVPGKKAVIQPFISARDHKRRFEGGRGANTGGMGAIAPVPDFTPALQKDFEEAILIPTLRGMEAEKMDYRGFIFFGLMIQDGSCYLLEYNVRLGDPETQAVLPLMDSDFAELCAAVADGSLKDFRIKWKKGAVCAPVAVSAGYPDVYRKGYPIAFNPAGFGKTGAVFFAAGAERGGGGALGSGLRTAGGRVFSVAGFGDDAEAARKEAYEALRFVNFEGMEFRRDIGCEKEYLAGLKPDPEKAGEGGGGDAGKRPRGRGRPPGGRGKRLEGKGKNPEGRVKKPEGRGKRLEDTGKNPGGKEKNPEGKGKNPGGKEKNPEGKGKNPEGKGKNPEGKVKNPRGRGKRLEDRGKRPQGKEKKPGGRGKRLEDTGINPEGRGKCLEGKGKNPGGRGKRRG